MREFYSPDPPQHGSFYGRVYGGRARFTPVITVVYEDGGNQTADVQFSCMKTYQPDGEPIFDAYGANATKVGPMMASVLVALLLGLYLS